MIKILLTRHGHVEGIKPERFRGRQPLELTAQGRADAAAVAQRIADAWQPSAIYTSPMGRSVATAAAIAKACGVAAKTCEDLNDIDYGAWTFKTFDDARKQNPDLFAAWFATPQLVRFPNEAGLSAQGDNLFTETTSSGAPQAGVPGSTGYGTIQQGFLETSNVNAVEEITSLITAQRAYEMNSKVVTAADQMLQTTSQMGNG